MYTTIEADLENGRLTGAEVGKLPSHAHVLITLLSTRETGRPSWQAIAPLMGKLHLREDSVEWQRELRSEWE